MKFDGVNHVGGRPKGVRNRLSHEFITALLKDFEEGGAAAIKIARLEDPLRYITIVASLMPRELAVEHNQLGDLSDDEVSALLEYVREQQAKLIEQPAPRIAKKRPLPVVQDTPPRIKVVGVLPDGR
jgi:hypothetical protein